MFRAYQLPAPNTLVQGTPQVAQNSDLAVDEADMTLLAMASPRGSSCGYAVLPDFGSGPSRYAYVPFGDATAVSGLRQNCAAVDAVLYEAFVFGAVGPAVVPMGDDAAEFPLAELRDPFFWQRVPASFPVLRPSDGLPLNLVENYLGDPVFRETLLETTVSTDTAGVCLDLSDYPDAAPGRIGAVMAQLNSALSGTDRKACLIRLAGAPFWFDLLNKFMSLRSSLPIATQQPATAAGGTPAPSANQDQTDTEG